MFSQGYTKLKWTLYILDSTPMSLENIRLWFDERLFSKLNITHLFTYFIEPNREVPSAASWMVFKFSVC